MDILFLGPSCDAASPEAGSASRQLVHALKRRGHAVLLLERAMPGTRAWGMALPVAPYLDLADLDARFRSRVERADLVLVDAHVSELATTAGWVADTARGLTVFWDHDTPRTRARHASRREAPGALTPQLLEGFRLYLCSSGGPVPRQLEREWGVTRARAFPPGVDAERFTPGGGGARWDLGHLGPPPAERRALLRLLMLEAARGWPEGRFVLAGMLSLVDGAWPANMALCPSPTAWRQAAFLDAQRFTLALSRADHTPEAGLFEAAARGAALICDPWPGLEDLFSLGEEVVLARTARDVLRHLREMPEAERRRLGTRARARVLAEHTVAHRAALLERYANEAERGTCLGAPLAVSVRSPS
jgi:spore maturation protein CgeB